MSPFIVSTKRSYRPHTNLGPYRTVSRRAVATLEEAHQAISDARVRACDTTKLAVFDFGDETLPGSGGSVGPLPDGTVIEVRRQTVAWLRHQLDDLGVQFGVHERPSVAAMCDVFNARQS